MRRTSLGLVLLIFVLVVWLATRSGLFTRIDERGRSVTGEGQVTGPSDPWIESSIPHVAMPDHVYRVLKSALDSLPAETAREREQLEGAPSALAQLRRIPWPDLGKLQCVRVSQKDPFENGEQTLLSWAVPVADGQFDVLNANFAVERVTVSSDTQIVPADHDEELQKILNGIAATDSETKLRWELSLLAWGINNRFEPSWHGTFLMNQAYAAAYFGKVEAATTLVHRALNQSPLCFENLYNQRAWQSFFRGVEMLEAGAARKQVLEQWWQTLRLYGRSDYRDQLVAYVAELESQVPEDDELAAETVADPDLLPVERRIDYYIARLPDVHGFQWSQPGSCSAVGCGEGTKISDALVAIGRPAMPRLIKHLRDQRLTRSVGFHRDYSPHRDVLRVQDVVIQIIDEITGIRFSHGYTSNLDREEQERLVTEVRNWWILWGDKPLIEGFVYRLNDRQVSIHERLELLRKVESMDPKAVDPIEVLKRWAREEGPWVPIAEALAERGDLSLLPAMRTGPQLFSNQIEAIWLLLRYGDANDIRRLREASRKDLESGAGPGQQSTYGAVAGGMYSKPRPLFVPILIDLLDPRFRQIDDSARRSYLEQLIAITGHDPGFDRTATQQERDAVFARWTEWWEREGKQQFVAEHPEVGEVLADRWTKLAAIDAERLPAFVDVADPRTMTPIVYWVPRTEVVELAGSGAVLGSAEPEGPIQFRFATADAATSWLARAALSRKANSPAPAMVVSVRGLAFPDTRGRMWCRWDAAESPPAVLDGNDWTVLPHATGKHTLADSRGYIAAFAGSNGAMVFVDDEHRFHLFDDDGWVLERSAQELATQHHERLVRALSAAPRAGRNYYYHMVADARGRIWWSNWSDAWGVVEPARAISGSTLPGFGPERRRRLEVLFPIGDGNRVLAVDDEFAGAVVDVQDESVVRVADAPVLPKSWTLNDWSTTVLRDSKDRVWFNSHYDAENRTRSQNGGQSYCIGPDGTVLMQHDGWLQLEDPQHGLWFIVQREFDRRDARSSAIERLDVSGSTTRFDLPQLTGNLALAPSGGVWALTDSEAILLRSDDSVIRVIDRIPAPARVKCGVWCDSANRVWLIREAQRSAVGRSDISIDELICLIPGEVPDSGQSGSNGVE